MIQGRTFTSTTEIADMIREQLASGGTWYTHTTGSDGYQITIRVSDHWANDHNNFWKNGESRVLSFVSSGDGKMDRPRMTDEWFIDEDGLTQYLDTIELTLSDFF